MLHGDDLPVGPDVQRHELRDLRRRRSAVLRRHRRHLQQQHARVRQRRELPDLRHNERRAVLRRQHVQLGLQLLGVERLSDLRRRRKSVLHREQLHRRRLHLGHLPHDVRRHRPELLQRKLWVE
jgi:hypothetical protein